MNPENANPKNFTVHSILFNNDEFSIAYGEWKDGINYIAMRWNGDEIDDKGYPKVFGNPMWFIIDNNLKIPFIKSLIDIPKSVKENLLKVLEKEL